MSPLKKFKKNYNQLKWYFFLSKEKLVNKEFSDLTLHGYSLESSAPINLEKTRKLLKLFPKWEQGHVLYAILSLKMYQATRNVFFKAAIRLSYEVVINIFPNSKDKTLVEAISNFVNQNYDKAIELLEARLVNNNLEYRCFSLETLGFSYITTGREAKALEVFNRIEMRYQTSEVLGIIKMLNSKIS